MTQCVIVGGGLFGSLAARLARLKGYEVTVVDSNEALAASPASGGVMKPSWLTGVDVKQAVAILEQFVAVRDVPFTFLGTTVHAYVVNPLDVLDPAPLRARAIRAEDGLVVLDNGQELRGHVLVAAGVWTNTLLPTIPVEGLAGVGFRVRGQLPVAFIKVWAPYKQIVAHQVDAAHLWVGDGSAIKDKNWTSERLEASKERCCGALPTYPKLKDVTALPGLRPKVPGQKYGLHQRLSPRLAVSTGGAKSGMAMAALMAETWVASLP
jgi:glycine/D-amino acid oxidase-like deaminating enzyme